MVRNILTTQWKCRTRFGIDGTRDIVVIGHPEEWKKAKGKVQKKID